MPESRRPSSQRQREGAPPIVDQPSKPRAGELVPPRRIERRMVTMADEPTPSRATRNTMDPFPERPRTAARRTPGDQQPLDTGRPAADETAPGYLRLRFRVENGEVLVRGVTFVEGPLDRPQTLSAGLGYQARVGRRSVAVGDVPEFTERRSFPDPTGRAGMERHHIAEMPFQDFTVRIPADQITEDELADLNVELFRWRGRGPGEHIHITDLPREPAVALTRIAMFSGLSAADVAAPVRRRLRAVARRRPR
jgi:hypothetical protein